MPLISDSIRNLAAGLVVMALIIAGLVLGKDILVPLALAVILAFILGPVVAWLIERNVPQGAAVGGMMLVVVAGLAIAAFAFSTQILSVTTTLAENRHNIASKLRNLTQETPDGMLTRAGRAISALEKTITGELQSATRANPPSANTASGPASPRTAPDGNAAVPPAKSSMTELAKPFIGSLATFLVAMLFTTFLLLQNHDLRDRIVRVLGTDNMSGTTAALSDAAERLGQLFLGQAMLNAGFGAFIALALWIIGVPNPLLWGVAAGLLRFVPYIGAFLSSLPPLFLAAAVDPGWTMFIATATVFIIVEPIMGHVVDPLVLGKRVGLSPFAMIAAASFWTLVWGPVGLLLAAPLTMVLVVIGEYIPQLNFLSILLGDKPALDPNTQFYHRLLSNDAASAIDQIEEEASADGGSLKAVATKTILPALRLAALDQRRGRIDAEKLGEIQETMEDVIEALPAPDSDGSTHDGNSSLQAVILPARGAIDILAGQFVAATLIRSGAGPVMALRETSGMMGIGALRSEMDRRPIGAIVLATVGGMDARHLQFLAKRAAKEFPELPVLVCNWGRSTDNVTELRPFDPAARNVMECTSVGELASLLQLRIPTAAGVSAPRAEGVPVQPASA
ncbi:MAG: AI-2E family transporter [Beijerinckiaceae bacterium]